MQVWLCTATTSTAFGCGAHFNDWDEALSLLLGVTKAEAHAVAPHYSSESLDAYRERAALEARRDPLPPAYADIYYRNLYKTRRHRLEWLYARGLTDETIALAKLGHSGTHFTIPLFDANGNLLSLRFRKDDEYVPDEDEDGKAFPKYSGMKGRNGLYLYGEWLLSQRPYDFTFVTEGELDALRLWQDGYPAVSATNGARQARNAPILLRRLFPTVRRLLVATDGDGPGTEAAAAVSAEGQRLGFGVVRCSWFVGKDITEYLKAGGKLEWLMKETVCEYNADRFESFTE